MDKQEVIDAITSKYLSDDLESLIRDQWDRGYYTAVQSIIDFIQDDL
jgi:hypothetical protein